MTAGQVWLCRGGFLTLMVGFWLVYAWACAGWRVDDDFLARGKTTDEGLKELKELTNLQTLSLADTKVTDKGLKELKELKNLTELNLSLTPVTDAGLKELKEALPKCSISMGKFASKKPLFCHYNGPTSTRTT